MTGECRSQRAVDLLKNCALPYIDDWKEIAVYLEKPGMSPKKRVPDLFEDKKDLYFSPIEAYIQLKDSSKVHLIEYLKGNTDNLEL